jgi:S1-C subfamily serine protease
MKLLAGLVLVALVWPSWAVEKMTAVTVNGVSYVQIQDAHIASGGRIVLLYPSGGATVAADKLPKAFLDSWGITAAKLAAAQIATERQTELEVNLAVRGGLFREVEGVVYDLRKPQAGWVQISGAKLLQITEGGALAELTPNNPNPAAIFIRNLPPSYADNDAISIFAKASKPFSYINRAGYERIVRSYDVGRPCARNELPEALLKDNLSFAALPNAPKSHDHPIAFLAGQNRLRAIGSGFFVTKDGYLVTDYHVVRDAQKIEVKYQDRVLPAKVAAEDQVNDLAVLKVEGGNFQPLSISRKETADLGQEVFTIGFPNIQMQGVEPKYTDGKISSLAGMQDDPSEYQISVPVQPGNSGGPLCDARGEVVGIIVARLSDKAMWETSGMMPQNVNYAVKSQLAVRLLQQVKGLAPSPNQGATSENPVKTVQNAIAMILIY